MKTFTYRLLGRTATTIEPIGYAGQVNALIAREAILAALVAEFGDLGAAKPLVKRLCDGGRIAIHRAFATNCSGVHLQIDGIYSAA